MELKEYGPLAQSKAAAESEKTSWVPLVVLLGMGIIIGITWTNMQHENQYWSSVKS